MDGHAQMLAIPMSALNFVSSEKNGKQLKAWKEFHHLVQQV